MNPVMLILTLMTAGSAPDINHQVPEPSLEQCWKDAAEFVKAGVPPGTSEKIIGIAAACAQQRPAEEHS